MSKKPSCKSKKPSCKIRLLRAIAADPKTPDELAALLFVGRRDVLENLEVLRRDGKAHRKFFHNARSNKPDYLYCAVKFPSRYKVSSDPRVAHLVGEWDTVDMQKVRQ